MGKPQSELADICDKIEILTKEIERLGFGNAISTNGIGAIEGMTMKLEDELKLQTSALERIAEALETIAANSEEDDV